MRTRWSIPALGAFFVAIALAVSACGSSLPNNAVATVAGNPISLKAFDHWLYVDAKGQSESSTASPVIAPNDPPNFTKCIADVRAQIPSLKKTATKTLKADCSQLFTSLSSQVMDFLIKAYWYQALAHKDGINLTTAQVQAALVKAKKTQFKTAAAYTSFLTESGQTSDDILYRVRVNQVYEKLIKKYPTTVTSAEIASYYAAHKSSYGTPQRRNMRIVLAKTKAQAQAALSALQSGQSWKTVAKTYSTDPTTKNNGGLLTDVTAGTQDAALSKAAFAATPNKLVGPVKGEFGYYVVDVIKVIPATQESLAKATPTIKTTLTTAKQTSAETKVNDAAKKLYFPKTTCRALYAMADCHGYKAPKTSTSSTTPATTGTASSTATTPSTSTGTASSSNSATTPAPSTATGTASSTTTTKSSS